MRNNYTKTEQSTIALYLEKGICPIKFSYINEQGAYAWDQIEKERAVDGGNFAEYELLINNTEIYLEELGNPKELALFDFGSGTGETVKGILLKLLKLGISVHYHAFDMSEEIIKICQKNIGELGENYTFNSTILDFESSNLVNILSETRSKYNNIPVMGMLLGSTIGNFDSMERIITNITDAFRISDRFVVGIEKVDVSDDRRKENIVKTYDNHLIYDLALSTLENFGLDRTKGTTKVIFNNKHLAIEVYIEMFEDESLLIGNNNVMLQKGDRIKLLQSKKLNEAQFAQMFLDLDLRIASMRTNEKNTFIEMMLSPKKY